MYSSNRSTTAARRVRLPLKPTDGPLCARLQSDTTAACNTYPSTARSARGKRASGCGVHPSPLPFQIQKPSLNRTARVSAVRAPVMPQSIRNRRWEDQALEAEWRRARQMAREAGSHLPGSSFVRQTITWNECIERLTPWIVPWCEAFTILFEPL